MWFMHLEPRAKYVLALLLSEYLSFSLISLCTAYLPLGLLGRNIISMHCCFGLARLKQVVFVYREVLLLYPTCAYGRQNY